MNISYDHEYYIKRTKLMNLIKKVGEEKGKLRGENDGKELKKEM